MRENVIMTPDHKTQGAINWFEAEKLDQTATFHVEVEILEEVGNGIKSMNEIVDDEELTAALFAKKEVKSIQRPSGMESNEIEEKMQRHKKWLNLTGRLRQRMSRLYGL